MWKFNNSKWNKNWKCNTNIIVESGTKISLKIEIGLNIEIGTNIEIRKKKWYKTALKMKLEQKTYEMRTRIKK